MKKHGSPLLTELMIVVLFFTLAASALMEVYTTAYTLTVRSRAETAALLDAQNIAEVLYACEEPSLALVAEGFQQTEEGWDKVFDSYTVRITGGEEALESGILRSYTVTAEKDGKTLLTLPATRFMEVRP